jgi:hypothetical protein
MPTAMPLLPFTSRFGNFAGRTVGSCSRSSKFGVNATVFLVDVGEQLAGQPRAAPPCSGRPPRCRRRWSRSCPGRPRAGSAARSPGPSAPSPRRPPSRRAGGTCRARHRPPSRSSCTAARRQPRLLHGVQDPAVHRLQPVPHVRQRALHDDAHRVVEERVPHLLLDEARQDLLGLLGRRRARHGLRMVLRAWARPGCISRVGGIPRRRRGCRTRKVPRCARGVPVRTRVWAAR